MQPAITNCRDDQLLGLIRRRHEDPERRRAGRLELYARHAKYVLGCVQRASSFVGRGLTAEDIVVQTFSEVYLRAADGFQAGEYATDDDARKHVRVWLGRIAHFEFLGAIQSRAHESIRLRDPELLSLRADAAHAMPSTDGQTLSEAQTLADAANAVLNPDELEILWLKMQHYDPETGESWVPPEEIHLVCEKQAISNPVFRKRYERALNKIREAPVGTDQASKIYKRRV